MITAINSFSPDILFVGMTAPKQEIWAYQNKERTNARIICSVGAVFEWYARVKNAPGKIWVKLGLEWLIRTIRRPEILKRYPDYLMFFWLLFLNIIRIRRD
jgi:N-acetylglucosaminyldiphosphoundecaprenol N-acetyl-beta-D-mannosaminyltransferase